MKLEEIKDAILEGKKVFWKNIGYEVIKGKFEYLIVWDLGGRSENCTGLTHTDGITMNGEEEDFFCYEGRVNNDT